MGERTEQLMDEIEAQRHELGENLHVLEEKVKETMDWRAQFEQHPMLGIGIAFAGGFLLSSMLPGGGSDSDSQSRSYQYDTSNYRINDESQSWKGAGNGQGANFTSQSQPKRPSPEMKEINETVENIRGAVMGLAATRLRSFLADTMPGFNDEYEEARRTRGNSEATRIQNDNGGSSQTASSPTWSPQERRTDDGGASPAMPSEQLAGAGMQTFRT